MEKWRWWMGFWILAVLFLAGTAAAEAPVPSAKDDFVTVPWSEFKTLYRESIEREIQAARPEEPEAAPFRYSIDEARYRLTLGAETAEGEAVLTGAVISGEPEAIPLFGPDMVIREVRETSGGTLRRDGDRIVFHPAGTEPFRIAFSLLAGVADDERSRFVGLGIPPALRNSLSLTVPAELRLLETPGLPDETGVFHFPAREELRVRFGAAVDTAPAPPEVDLLTRIRIQGRRPLLTTTVLTRRPPPVDYTLRIPDGFRFLDADLPRSRIAVRAEGEIAVTLPENAPPSFQFRLAGPEIGEDGAFAPRLPRVAENTGVEGRFVVAPPEDGKLTLAESDLFPRIPADRLPPALAQAVSDHRFVRELPSDRAIALTLHRFQTVATPAIVLDDLAFYTAFEETGGNLSVLSMEVPPEAGERLELRAVPGAAIWSLTVNGARKKVYGDAGERWIIPLDAGISSRVELAFIRTGEPLGLQGRLEARLPAVGFPARRLLVGVALPARVELRSLEGPLGPAPAEDRSPPAAFVGEGYFFSRSFHNGEAVSLAVSYKEPVNRRPAATQAAVERSAQ
jgi:hypothetical protein